MAKVSRIFTTVALGVVGGAAAAVFLASKTGKAAKEKVLTLVKDYQENPEELHAQWLEKAQDLKDDALSKYQEVKEQVASGELTYEDVLQTGRDKTALFKEQAAERIAQLRERLAHQEVPSADIVDSVVDTVEEALPEDVVIQDDIEITL